jgi:hypothetical protein
VADLIAAADERWDGHPWHSHAYHPDVTVISVLVTDEGAGATVELRFNHAAHPGERFGARLRLQEHLFSDLDFNADRPELIVAEHVLVALGELSFAGGDPMLWNSDHRGTRWYVDDMY